MEESIQINFPSPKTIAVWIEGIEYQISANLTTDDLFTILRARKQDNPDYKSTIAEILAHKIGCTGNDCPDQKTLEKLPDDVYTPFFDGLLSTSSSLQDYYLKHSDEADIYARMVKAMSDEVENMFTEIAKASEGLVKTATECISAFARVISSDYTQTIIKNFAETMATLGQRLLDASAGASSISLEDQNRLVAIYKKWGEMGWTTPCNAEFCFLDTEPVDKKHATEIMEQFTTKEHMDELFMMTRSYKGVAEEDYEEAVKCFENNCFKSCCMMLFSLIDGMWIQMQMEYDSVLFEQAQIGTKGIQYFKKKAENANESENLLYEYLAVENITTCMNEMYRRFKDSAPDAALINRNVLMHGAMTREVTVYDCLQLFFLYFNLLEQREIIDFDYAIARGEKVI